jgi:hypothetical protein
LLIAFTLSCFSADAQVTQKVKKGAKKVGNKTAEVASKSKARTTDKRYEGKVGPAGQTIYINDDGSYYWVNKKGQHQSITEAELKDKK